MSTAYSAALAALQSGEPLAEQDAARLLRELREEIAHDLAQRIRSGARSKYRRAPGDTRGKERIKGRQLGAAMWSATLIDPKTPKPAPPSAPAVPTERTAEQSPAEKLAERLDRGAMDVERIEIVSPTQITVQIRPRWAVEWDWWQAHFAIDLGSITHRGNDVATARGARDGVQVAFLIYGLVTLQSARHPAPKPKPPANRPAVPAQRDGAHENRSTD